MILACPRCHRPLERADGRLACADGHHYDLAREGYVNLLRPGVRVAGADTAEMLAARRSFLDLGHYAPLAVELAALMAAHGPDVARPEVLDAGCGEGYHLRRLGQVLAEESGVVTARTGVDLARDAVRRAARRDPEATFAVGTVHGLPVRSDVVDVALSVFAHRSFPEFARVLRPDGLLLVVTPGRGHLRQLRRLLGRGASDGAERLEYETHGGPLRRTARRGLAYTVRLDSARELVDLFRMTPFWLQARPDESERLARADDLTLDVHFELHAFRRSGRPASGS